MNTNDSSALDRRFFEMVVDFLGRADLVELRASMQERGYAILRNMIKPELLDELRGECWNLLESSGVERDFLMRQTANTPRRMVNVRCEEIRSQGRLIPALYQSVAFRRLFEVITRETFVECPYEPEQYIVNALFKSGHTHGWHWDDYKYGVNIAVETPDKESGGYVQLVPNTSWNRERPSVEEVLFSNQILSFRLEPGDVYILRTDTGLHRVSPINAGSRRIIVNMVWSTPEEVQTVTTHDTMEEIFA
ncbi:HalD/BesD family halogenase [Azohydromonas caseinilytica]|uniref:Fe2OG dioxygenase domain-containing protein n=1 Tax=Azohydromonas caseinilytica TaxID=2728836 RepID=A0A848FAP0_9BURK|nr:hypothetical protein [Azohydromonas caseinilytica]NML15936.1 hypothetical protein [Azohydromonas caseinilytica]